jgi:NAD+ kinase
MHSPPAPCPLPPAPCPLLLLPAYKCTAQPACNMPYICLTPLAPLSLRPAPQVHYAGRLQRVHHVLNEAVIDRGSFPGAVFLEIYVDGNFVTAAEADGLIIATPSGSTAYSMSAGGPMVAPSVPCTLLTPLAPLSLSFRPLIVPESSDIMVRLPGYSRSHARASFDGKHPLRVPKESNVHFTTSLCPLPVINMNTLDVDWYEGITQKLKWNQQIRDPPPPGQYESDLEAGLGGGRPWQAGGDGAGYS